MSQLDTSITKGLGGISLYNPKFFFELVSSGKIQKEYLRAAERRDLPYVSPVYANEKSKIKDPSKSFGHQGNTKSDSFSWVKPNPSVHNKATMLVRDKYVR